MVFLEAYAPGSYCLITGKFFLGLYFMRTSGAAYAARLGLRFSPSELILLILDAAASVLLWYGIARVSYRAVGRWPFTATVLVLAVIMASGRYSALP